MIELQDVVQSLIAGVMCGFCYSYGKRRGFVEGVKEAKIIINSHFGGDK